VVGADPLTIRADGVAAWIGDMRQRPGARGANVVRLDTAAGLSNATIQQRVVAVRPFYEFLVEDGLRAQPGPARALPPGTTVEPGRVWCAASSRHRGFPVRPRGDPC
jgi:hypothetical protein